MAHSLFSWDPENPAEWIGCSWWTQFPGQHLPDLSFEEARHRALINGPASDHGVGPAPPLQRTVSYAGPAGGMYTCDAGSGRGEDEGFWWSTSSWGPAP